MLAWNGKSGFALIARIESAGHWVRTDYIEGLGAVQTCSDEAAVQAIIDAYTLADARAEKVEAIARFARDLRNRIIADYSPAEMAAWPIKLAEARAYAASGSAADAPLLAAEAQARGITLAALVARVDGNAQTFAALEAQIAGVDGLHRDAVAALQTFEGIAAYDFSGGWPA